MSAIQSIAGLATAVGLSLLAASVAQAGGTVGTTFPDGFQVPADSSLNKPVIGFGDKGKVRRTPVIFLHGNDDTPYPTGCATRTLVRMDQFAQYFADNGYSTSELWALGYQGDQCDQVATATFGATSTKSSGGEHTVGANVKDLRAFIDAVLSFTGAQSVDIIAYDMGAVLAREWVRQDKAGRMVRRFVSIDAPNNGTLMCSPDPANYWSMAMYGSYTPGSPVCQELGSPNTSFLQTLNGARDGNRISPSATLVIRNGDSSYPYMPWNDGSWSGVPSLDIDGVPTDFTGSASVKGGWELTLTGQHGWDPNVLQQSAHAGIAMSPTTWQAALDFLTRKK